MSAKTSGSPAAFEDAFRPGEMLPESAHQRLHQYLPPGEAETCADYAQRAARAGLAIILTSDQARDFLGFKAAVAEAESRHIPIMMLTMQAPDPTTRPPTSQAVKSAALARARGRLASS
jgi:hypothetical protein